MALTHPEDTALHRPWATSALQSSHPGSAGTPRASAAPKEMSLTGSAMALVPTAPPSTETEPKAPEHQGS